MKTIYCIKCNKYRKSKNTKILHILNTLGLSIICDKCGSNDEWNEIIKIHGLISKMKGSNISYQMNI